MRAWTFMAAGLAFALGGLVAPLSVSAQVVVALSGNPAPAGGNYYNSNPDAPNTTFTNVPVLNQSGQVAFTAYLAGGSSTEGLFAGAPGSLQPVALQGTAAPGGGIYNRAEGAAPAPTPSAVSC